MNGAENKKKRNTARGGTSQKGAYNNRRREGFGGEETALAESVVVGRNAVRELLRSGRSVDKIFVQHGEKEGSIVKIIAMAKEAGIVVVEADKQKLESIAGSANHQGVAAFATDFVYSEPEDILEFAESKGEKPFILVLDGITDPHNLGAIIRTADACGVHGIILPKRNCCGLTATVFKAAAGACEYMKIAKVVNIAEAVSFLKAQNVWVYGADGDATSDIYSTDLTGAVAIVLGD